MKKSVQPFLLFSAMLAGHFASAQCDVLCPNDIAVKTDANACGAQVSAPLGLSSTCLGDWMHKAEIIIASDNPIALADYQVRIVVNTAIPIGSGKMKADGSDIRFTDENCLELPYWIESGLNTANTVIWVRLPSVQADGTTTIHLFYGNPFATAVSSGTATFDLFDDFNDGDASGWSFGSGAWSVSDSALKATNPGLENGIAAVMAASLTLTEYVVETDYRPVLVNSNGGPLFEFDDFSNYYAMHSMPNTSMIMHTLIGGGSANYSQHWHYMHTAGQWYNFRVEHGPVFNKIYFNQSFVANVTQHFTSGAGVWAYSGDCLFDNFRVRKYADRVPGASVGTEEPNGNNDLCRNITITNDYNHTADASGFYPAGTTLVTYTATDGSGRVSACSFTVTVIPEPMQVSLSSPAFNGYNISCNGGNNGEITAIVTGGCLPYSFSWSNGQTTETIGGLTAGIYDVTVTDNNGQVMVQGITLTEPAPLLADAGSNATVYYGYDPNACTNLVSSVSGGIPGYTYSWSTGETTANITVCPSSTTTYILTVTDRNGCVTGDSSMVCVINVHCEKGGKAIRKYQGEKVMVCHRTGNGKTQTLCIAPSTVASHLAHGDALGDCGDGSDCNFINAKRNGADDPEDISTGAGIVAYPNPFSQAATIRFSLFADDHATLIVYNLSGQQVDILFDNHVRGGYMYEARFDAKELPAGIYIYRLLGESGIAKTGKIILNR